jgi:hypothetical protein
VIDVEMLLNMIEDAPTAALGVLAVYDLGYENGIVSGYTRGSTDVGLAWTTDGQNSQ